MSTRNYDGAKMTTPPIVAWTVRDWAEQTSLSKSYVYILINARKITSVKSGKKRLITTSPAAYIQSLAA
jgi:excisionase family DNA binding protein